MRYPRANSETKAFQACLRCGSTELDKARRDVEFEYGGREKPFRFKASFPFNTCRRCGFSFLDGDDEELQHEAACRHLGVMTPAEVLDLRTKMGLSQKELAELTGLGVASLSRWERGLLIQNEASDQLLYLLTFPENLERLRQRKISNAPSNSTPSNRITSKYSNAQDRAKQAAAACKFSLN
jgi:putative zinc finger/helix-turn-helix YgiT family protein